MHVSVNKEFTSENSQYYAEKVMAVCIKKMFYI